MCNNVRILFKIFSYAFTTYSGLNIALHKRTAAHKYWILENWRIARRTFLSKSFLSFLNDCGPWRNAFEEKWLTRNEIITVAALEQQLQR